MKVKVKKSGKNASIISRLKRAKQMRRDSESYVSYSLLKKFIWKKIYYLLKNMAQSLLVNIDTRIKRISSNYDALISQKRELRSTARQLELDSIQLNMAREKIGEMKDDLSLFDIDSLEEALEFYKKLPKEGLSD